MQSHENYKSIALFERFQSVNWQNDTGPPSVTDITKAISNSFNWVYDKAKEKSFSLSSTSIREIHFHLSKTLDLSFEDAFIDEEKWEAFIGEMYGPDDKLLNASNVSGSEAWILSQLYWNHLGSFKLAVPLLYISALDIQNGGHGFGISLNNIGAFLMDLSFSGPNMYDAENLRANIRKYV